MQVRKASAQDVMRAYGLEAWVGVVDNKVTCIGGFRRDGEHLWAFLDVFNNTKMPVRLFRVIKRKLEQKGQTTLAICDAKYETAPRLLSMLGFEQTDEMLNGLRVWIWRPSH